MLLLVWVGVVEMRDPPGQDIHGSILLLDLWGEPQSQRLGRPVGMESRSMGVTPRSIFWRRCYMNLILSRHWDMDGSGSEEGAPCEQRHSLCPVLPTSPPRPHLVPVLPSVPRKTW